MNRSLFIMLLASYAVAGENTGISADDDTLTWKAGVASVVVTPDEPMWMAGYAARDSP